MSVSKASVSDAAASEASISEVAARPFLFLLILAITCWATALTTIIFGLTAVTIITGAVVLPNLLPQLKRVLPGTVRIIIIGVHLVTLVAVLLAGNLRSDEHLDAAVKHSEMILIEVEITGYCTGGVSASSQRCKGIIQTEAGVPKPATIILKTDHATRIGTKYQAWATIGHNSWEQATHYRATVHSVGKQQHEKPLNRWLNTIREELTDRAATLPAPGGPLIPGMAIGQTVLVNETLDAAMKTTSLSHLTAVSGSNFSLVVLSIMMLASLLGARPGLKIMIGMIALVLFFLLVTEEPSVIRAATMMVITIAAQMVGRPGMTENLLSITILFVILFDPWKAVSFGFALSAAATAGLVYLSGPMSNLFARKMPRPAAVALAVPLSAQLWCEPILILLDPYISGYGVLANLLAAPLAPIATACGLVAGIILPVFAPLGDVLLWIAWLPSHLIGLMAEFLGTSPGSKLHWSEGIPGFVIATTIVATIFYTITHPDTTKRYITTFVTNLVRNRRYRFSVIAAVGLILLSQQATIFVSKPPLNNWHVALCDVGQGTALLIQSGTQRALIDTGPSSDALEQCLNTLGLDTIDLVIITHFDDDHIGGINALRKIRTKRVLYSAITDEHVRIIESAFPDTPSVQAEKGMSGRLGEYRWEVLWPDTNFPTTDTNQASVVTVFDGPLSVISLGDINESTQRALYATNPIRHIPVVAVAHHGSRDQSPILYEALAPHIVLFPVGHNTYGHPASDTLDFFEHATVFRTDTDGLILLRKTPAAEHSTTPAAEPSSKIDVWTER